VRDADCAPTNVCVTAVGHTAAVTIAPPHAPSDPGAPDLCDGERGRPDLLGQLRAAGTERPEVDAGLAGGLRAWLEDAALLGVAPHAAGAPGAPGARRPAAAPSPVGPPVGRRLGLPELTACITRTLFRLTVTDGPPSHPFEDALSAIAVTARGAEVLDAVQLLRQRTRAALRTIARARGTAIGSDWPRIPAAWLPRTGERLRVPLAGGAVVLHARADLVLGRPSHGTASVCLVQVQVRDGDDGRARRLLALAETLRSGAPPVRVATYRPSSRELVCEEVTESLLVETVREIVDDVGGRFRQ
jgi:hypothetical protein